MKGFAMKWLVGSLLDLTALGLGMVAGGLMPTLGPLSGPVYAGVLLIVFQPIDLAVGAMIK